MAKPSVTMKLLIDLQAKRVLFAEANNDCVDFLFHLLSLPVATVITLLKEETGMEGPMVNLYDSIAKLNDSYLQPNRSKCALLKPVVSLPYQVPVPLLQHNAAESESDGEKRAEGFVKDVVTYMVLDNLVVEPMSTISCLTLLSRFKVKDVAALEEKVVQLDFHKAVRVLRAALQSEMVLTEVYLKEDKSPKNGGDKNEEDDFCSCEK
ncbi:uncharacterized protein LOC127260177 isoform X1 [Andrographis paniculata]|uniref:uncharacterized protein LOC127260177 isoform X1 n=1 Tax=Andrographis paniculata TaxID=175694 RepID=UPI0021E74E4C|nr:uncharacterized protein LOC127260177 isoform X1 [Andrographis paniculata]